MSALDAFVAASLARPVPRAVSHAAERLAEAFGGVAVLFYGSVLRTGVLDDVLDFYVLTAPRGSSRGRLWPDVHYREIDVDSRLLRAKVATMPLDAFNDMAAGQTRDTTIWTRFSQPSALAWSVDHSAAVTVHAAVANASVTAARFAVLHGPVVGDALDYWRALFRATYVTELRFEAPGREVAIVSAHAHHFAKLLPLAWSAGYVGYAKQGDRFAPTLDDREDVARTWARAARVGRALNAARLVKAAFTFDGASAYALYKIERHTGVALALTPWRARHPILAAPGVLWQVWRAR